MELKKIEQEFSVCKVRDISVIDFTDEFCFIGKTDEELSLVCSMEFYPVYLRFWLKIKSAFLRCRHIIRIIFW